MTRQYYTPEKRFEILEKAKTSPAYRDLAALDRLNWQDAHPILSMFQGPPVRKPDGWDERQAQIKEQDRKYFELHEQLNVLLQGDFNERDRSKAKEVLNALEGITKARSGGVE